MRQFYTEGDLLSVRGEQGVHDACRECAHPPVISAGWSVTAQAKVESFFQDGALSLHTRSMKYGKVAYDMSRPADEIPCTGAHRLSCIRRIVRVPQLTNGTFLVVPPALVKRSASHFVTLPCKVDVILGLNGYVWVSVARGPEAPGAAADRDGGDDDDELDIGRDNDAEPQAPFGGADESEVRPAAARRG